jgi:hypothetical protein
MRTFALLSALAVVGGACSSATSTPPPVGASLASTDTNLSGCKGKASSDIPADGVYVITTFGGPSESQQMSCGSHTQAGSWYYAASRQRYGCGSLVRIEANGKCVIAKTDDYGPDVCVEKAAKRPIMDVSPLVAQHLFGMSGMGWSDGQLVTVSLASGNEALGPCDGGAPPDPSGAGGAGGTGGASSCFCDDVCAEYGDCCASCPSGSGGSGSGGAGGSGSGGSGGGAQCYCDAACVEYGDCCANCGGSGSSGGASGSGGSGGSPCYCDESCIDYGDCCSDCP